MTSILCVAGFGDDASMFDPLLEAAAETDLQFHPINLPGFGAPSLTEQATSLKSLAAYVADQADAIGANTVLAHSVASIIASLAAERTGSPISSILSLEGNLTPEDAYFSGSAAGYASAETFRPAFLARLADLAKGDPIIARYRRRVEQADPHALWALGCDAHAFSQEQSPGAWLQSVPRVAYLYNSDNVPPASLAWLHQNPLPAYELPGASHWASVDQPHLLLKRIEEALQTWEG